MASSDLMRAIAQDIVAKAQQRGVDPRFALGVAFREGLNPNTIGSPTFGNRDARGYSYGPWQLFSGSPQAGAVAPGGMAAEFQRKYGMAPSAENWRQQNDFALGLMQGKSPQSLATTWYSIRDAGGPAAITNIGAQKMKALGLLGDMPAPDTSVGNMAPQGFTPNAPQPTQIAGEHMQLPGVVPAEPVAPETFLGLNKDQYGGLEKGLGGLQKMLGGQEQQQPQQEQIRHFGLLGSPMGDQLTKKPGVFQYQGIGRRRGLLG